MTEKIIEFLGTIFRNFEYRELVYAMLAIECVASCVFLTASFCITTGSGYCLGEKYGKTNYFAAAIKYTFLAVGSLLLINTVLFWILDFITHMSFGYFFAGLGGILLFIVFAGLGVSVKTSKEEKLAKKHSEEIKKILFANPIFVKTIEIINSNSSIKRIHIYRDGIAFYEYQGELPIAVTERITEGAWDYESAVKLLEDRKKIWLAANGTVFKCGCSTYLSFIDFGFANSETAMNEFPKYIDKFTSSDFSKHYDYSKTWSYSSVLHIPPTTYAAGGKVYSTGGSDKTLSTSAHALAYVVVTGEKQTSEEKHVDKKEQHWPKKW